MATNARVRPPKRLYCPQCEESVSHATYYHHRERFYDNESGEWTAVATRDGDKGGSGGETDDLSTRSRSPLDAIQDESSETGFSCSVDDWI